MFCYLLFTFLYLSNYILQPELYVRWCQIKISDISENRSEGIRELGGKFTPSFYSFQKWDVYEYYRSLKKDFNEAALSAYYKIYSMLQFCLVLLSVLSFKNVSIELPYKLVLSRKENVDSCKNALSLRHPRSQTKGPVIKVI